MTDTGSSTVTLDLDALVLDTGKHDKPEDGACVMEAVALLAGERWTDHPTCASSVLGAFLRSWNDRLPTDERQALKQYIPRLVGSKGTPEQEDARAWMAMDWLVRTYTPVWLRFSAATAPQYSAGLAAHAEILAGLPEFKAGMDVPSIRPAINAARTDAAAAWAAAGDAAGDAARAAARAALRPTAEGLQASAFDLLDRMVAVGRPVAA